MSSNKTLVLLTSVLLIILATGCSKTAVPQLDAFVLDFSQEKALVFRIKNYERATYFIPKNSWLSNIGDTLYVEGVYKRRKNTDPIISYYQFNPPAMQEVKHDSSFIIKIDYSDLQVDFSKIVGIRIFKNDIPYDKDKDHQEYHSEIEFLKYERASSFLLFTKIHSLDSLSEW